MTMNPFGHVDLRVRDRLEARAFYSRLLPALGFTRFSEGEHFDSFMTPGELPAAAFFGYTEAPAHVPNENRIAFWVASPEEVERISALAVAAGAEIESGPRACPEYGGTYYATFFRDPSGNRLEVYYRLMEADG